MNFGLPHTSEGRNKAEIIRDIGFSFILSLSRNILSFIKIIMCFWKTAHLPLPQANIYTYFSLRANCWLRGGVGGQFPRPFLPLHYVVHGLLSMTKHEWSDRNWPAFVQLASLLLKRTVNHNQSILNPTVNFYELQALQKSPANDAILGLDLGAYFCLSKNAWAIKQSVIVPSSYFHEK